MRILVLGGTGAMGIHLVKLLAERGDDVIVTTRKRRADKSNIHFLQGDAHDKSFLEEILNEKWDVIVDFMVYSTQSFTERLHLLLDSTKQYVFLSSARVYAESKQSITEKSPRLLNVSCDKEFLLTDEYSLTKARQEDILRNSSFKNWTIIRPYITYSADRLQLGVLEKEEWLYRALQGRTIVFSNDINTRMTTLTYGLDVSKGILAVIGNSKTYGNIFHITKKNSNTWREVLDIYLEVLEKHLGYKPKVLLQNLDKFFEFKPAKYQVLYDRIFNRQFDSSKIAKFVDVDKFVDIEIGLQTCLRKFLEKPKFKNINWKSEAIKDRQTKEHTRLKEIQGFKQKMKYLVFRYLVK